MKNLIGFFHNSLFLGKLFHTLNFCLQKELKNCRTVLDLGCGPNSPISCCKNITKSLGVEPFKPYLEKSRKAGKHTDYLNEKIESLKLPKKSFDGVILIEVLEHLPKSEGLKIMRKMEKWAKKKIIITTPNGFIIQKGVDNNPLQKHLSGWTTKEIAALGYKIRGLAGLKILRHEVRAKTMGDDLLTTIKYKPKLFWFVVATLSQVIVYFLPSLAFELFCFKKIKDE